MARFYRLRRSSGLRHETSKQSGCEPSQTEIMFDITLSDSSNRTTAHFGNVAGGLIVVGSAVTFQSAHWYGGQPVGGNILFLDGHGEWRAFKQMQPRAQMPNGTTPIFWW